MALVTVLARSRRGCLLLGRCCFIVILLLYFYCELVGELVATDGIIVRKCSVLPNLISGDHVRGEGQAVAELERETDITLVSKHHLEFDWRICVGSPGPLVCKEATLYVERRMSNKWY